MKGIGMVLGINVALTGATFIQMLLCPFYPAREAPEPVSAWMVVLITCWVAINVAALFKAVALDTGDDR